VSRPRYQRIDPRKITQAAFLTPFGSGTRQEVSVDPENRKGTPYLEMPEGQVYAVAPNGYHRPMAADALTEAMGGAGNAFKVSETRQFFDGDVVELPTSVADGADRFREITVIDDDADQLTVDGGTFNLAKGDKVEVDPSRVVQKVQDAGSNTGSTITVEDASEYTPNTTVLVGPATSKAVLKVGGGGDGDYAVSAVVKDADGETVAEADAEYTASSDSAGTIAGEIQSDINDALSNAGEGSAAVQNTDEVAITLSDPTRELAITFQDPNSELSILSTDDSVDRTITSIDEGADTITLDESVGFSNGERVVSEPQGGYKVAHEPVRLGEYTYTPQNVTVGTRRVGKVRESVLTGLTSRAKEELRKGGITFSQTAI